MAPNSTSARAHPVAQAAGIDFFLVMFSVGAAMMSFATGQGVPNWHNIVFPPIVMMLAATVLMLAVAEIRLFRRTAGDSQHKVSAVLEVLVAMASIVVVGPMLLIMPFIFFGAIV